jgi:hypothetical protein
MIKNTLYITYSLLRTFAGLYDRAKWIKSSLLKMMVSLLSGILFYLQFRSSFSNTKPISQGDLLSFGLSTFSLSFFLIESIKFFIIARKDIVFEKLDNLSEENTLCDKDSIDTFNGQSIVYSKNTNLILEKYHNPIELNETLFELHPLITEYLPFFILKMKGANIDTFDSFKLKLQSDLTPAIIENNSTIYLQKTSYFRDRLSNTLANYRLTYNSRLFLNLRSEVLGEKNRLLNLRESNMSNQLGASVILITSDSTITFLKQGNRTAEN